MGRMLVFDTHVTGPRRYIINSPTKKHGRGSSRLTDIEAGLDALVSTVREHRIASLAIPALGCGNGGLRWQEVRPLIEAACHRMPGVRCVVFPPEGAPAAASMPNATPRPALTALRALLLAAIARYLDRAHLLEVREGISELEIQKLAYFLQVLGAPLRLTFVRGRYGPYSEDLTHLLVRLDGHYLTGFGDRSAHVAELVPINTTPGTVDAAWKIVAENAADQSCVEALLALADGFETPYSLELLGTVHFAAHRSPPTGDPTTLADRVASWNLRKARLFTEYQVHVAAGRLAEHHLLPA